MQNEDENNQKFTIQNEKSVFEMGDHFTISTED